MQGEIGKRGQLTLFMIVGILLLVIAGSIFFISSTQREPLEAQAVDVILPLTSVQFYVEHCLERTAEEAILENGRQGGYFLLPEHSTTDLIKNVPYYYELGQEHFPADEEIAAQVAHYVDALLFICLDNFAPFAERGLAIRAEEPSTKVSLSPRRLLLQTRMPTTISQDVQIRTIDVYTASLDARQLHENIALAKEVVLSAGGNLNGESLPGVRLAEEGLAESNLKEERLTSTGLAGDGSICLTCFSNLAVENDVFVGILPYYDNTYIFELEDHDYELNCEKYLLRFAVRHGTSREGRE